MIRQFTADFETNVYEEDCRVWAYALCEIGDTDNFIYGNSMDDFMEWCASPVYNYKLYFHNLKYDGEYIISWLLSNGFEHIENKKDRRTHTFTTLVTDMGVFYSIEIYFKVKGHHTNKVTIQDSLKILNFSVDKIAKDFGLPISKLSIDYREFREKGHQLTQQEIDYIRNDVTIVALGLEKMFAEGLNKMTIGSDAMSDFKSRCKRFRSVFPLLKLPIDHEIRQSYKGGFTYLNPVWEEKETGSGIVFDVNSMYPAKMRYEMLPFGTPMQFEGKYEYDPVRPLYVQKLTCVFDIKKGKIPSIQIKNSMSFMPNKYIESSNGELVTLTLCSPDLELFFKHYDVKYITWHGGWKFMATTGLFTSYIEYWTNKKIQSKKDDNKSMYAISKLMLNSLYGKFGLNPVGRKKTPYIDEEGIVKYAIGKKEERKPVYIPVATFITAYARKYIIESSQAIRDYSLKKYGVDCYVYSDTDSIHCLLSEDDVQELSKILEIDDYKLGAWKLESKFIRGKYLHQKCYIEQDYNGNVNVTVAGLPKKLSSLVNFDNFKKGFSTADLPAEDIARTGKKLIYKHVKGGVLLVETDFTIK